MSKLFSFSLYYISFAPLWISVLFIDIKSCIENSSDLWTEKISIGVILVSALICLIVLMIELCTNGKEGTIPQTLKKAKEEKTITAEYLLSYILPLFAFDFTVWNEVVPLPGPADCSPPPTAWRDCAPRNADGEVWRRLPSFPEQQRPC